MTTVLLHTGQTAPKLERPQPQVRVVRGGRHGLSRARQVALSMLNVLAVALLLGLIVSVVYSQAKITELNGTAQMSEITSRSSLQQVAEGELGLVQLDPSQVTYIQLEDENVIEKSSGGAGALLADVRTAALSLLGGLNP